MMITAAAAAATAAAEGQHACNRHDRDASHSCKHRTGLQQQQLICLHTVMLQLLYSGPVDNTSHWFPASCMQSRSWRT
jgi:hypothetical protein